MVEPRCLRHSVWLAACPDCAAAHAARVAAAQARIAAAKAERPCRCRQCTLNREQAAQRRRGAR